MGLLDMRQVQGRIVKILLATLLLFSVSVVVAEPVKSGGIEKSAPIVMGVFPRRNVKATYRMFMPLARYLSDKLERKVELRTNKDFKTFWAALLQGEYDIVHMNQYHYVLANERQGYQAIVSNIEYGQKEIAGVLMTRKDSGIDSVAELRGKRVLFGGGPRAMQSYIVARWLLQNAGLARGDYIEIFAKNPPNAIISTSHNQAEAAGVGNVVLKLKVVNQSINIDEVKFLAKGPMLTHLPWAVGKHVDTVTKEKIAKILLDMKHTETGRQVLKKAELDGFTIVQDSDFDLHREIIRDIYGDTYEVDAR